MDRATPSARTPPLAGLGADWFDPLEDAVRGQVRAFIERLLEEELDATLGRGRYARYLAAKGRRNDHRERRLDTTFGPLVLELSADAAPYPTCINSGRPDPPREGVACQYLQRGHRADAGRPKVSP